MLRGLIKFRNLLRLEGFSFPHRMHACGITEWVCCCVVLPYPVVQPAPHHRIMHLQSSCRTQLLPHAAPAPCTTVLLACMQPDEPMQQRRAVRPPCAKPGRSAPAAAWRPAPRRPLPCNVCSGCRVRPNDCDSCGRRADHVGCAGPCQSQAPAMPPGGRGAALGPASSIAGAQLARRWQGAQRA